MRIEVRQAAIPLAIAAMIHGAKSEAEARKAIVDFDIDIASVSKYTGPANEPNCWLVLRKGRSKESFEIWI